MEENNSVLMGTAATIGLFLLSIAYNLTWAVLFFVMIGYNDFEPDCNKLVIWNHALYIMYFIIASMSLLQFIFQLINNKFKKESNVPSILIGCKSCLNCFGGLIILVGICVEYFKVNDKSHCGSLQKVNLSFIVTEFSIYALFCLFTLSAGIFASCKNSDDEA